VQSTYLLDSLHQKMLVSLTQLLNPSNNLLILLALHRDRDRYPAHDERRTNMAILRNRLQIRDFKPARRFLQDFSKVLREESVETF
jgi:hypothetical protein